MRNLIEESKAAVRLLTLAVLYGMFELGKACDQLAASRLDKWEPSIMKVIDRKLENIEKWLPTV